MKPSEKQKVLEKRTYWVPYNAQVEMAQLVEFLQKNPDHIPYMCRSLKTGRMAKCV